MGEKHGTLTSLPNNYIGKRTFSQKIYEDHHTQWHHDTEHNKIYLMTFSLTALDILGPIHKTSFSL